MGSLTWLQVRSRLYWSSWANAYPLVLRLMVWDNRSSEQWCSLFYESLVDTHWGKCLDPRDNNLKKGKPWRREVGVTGVFGECRGWWILFFLSRGLDLITTNFSCMKS